MQYFVNHPAYIGKLNGNHKQKTLTRRRFGAQRTADVKRPSQAEPNHH